jgi:putative membrane protein
VQFFSRLIIGILSFALATLVVPGIYIDNWATLIIASFLFGIINGVIRPVIVLLTFPLTLLTFGIFLFFINAAMFALVAWILPGFYVKNFTAAFLGWLVVAITSFLGIKLLGESR